MVKCVSRVFGAIRQRPWLPAFAYGVCCAAFLLVIFITFANFFHGMWRFMPELSQGTLAFLCMIADNLLRVLFFGTVLMVVVPIFFMFSRTFRETALRVWKANLIAIAISVAVFLLLGPVIVVSSLELGDAQHQEVQK